MLKLKFKKLKFKIYSVNTPEIADPGKVILHEDDYVGTLETTCLPSLGNVIEIREPHITKTPTCFKVLALKYIFTAGKGKNKSKVSFALICYRYQ